MLDIYISGYIQERIKLGQFLKTNHEAQDFCSWDLRNLGYNIATKKIVITIAAWIYNAYYLIAIYSVYTVHCMVPPCVGMSVCRWNVIHTWEDSSLLLVHICIALHCWFIGGGWLLCGQCIENWGVHWCPYTACTFGKFLYWLENPVCV